MGRNIAWQSQTMRELISPSLVRRFLWLSISKNGLNWLSTDLDSIVISVPSEYAPRDISGSGSSSSTTGAQPTASGGGSNNNSATSIALYNPLLLLLATICIFLRRLHWVIEYVIKAEWDCRQLLLDLYKDLDGPCNFSFDMNCLLTRRSYVKTIYFRPRARQVASLLFLDNAQRHKVPRLPIWVISPSGLLSTL